MCRSSGAKRVCLRCGVSHGRNMESHHLEEQGGPSETRSSAVEGSRLRRRRDPVQALPSANLLSVVLQSCAYGPILDWESNYSHRGA